MLTVHGVVVNPDRAQRNPGPEFETSPQDAIPSSPHTVYISSSYIRIHQMTAFDPGRHSYTYQNLVKLEWLDAGKPNTSYISINSDSCGSRYNLMLSV